LLALEYHSDDGLAAAAQRLGYFDQAHLAREFRAIAGTTITDYRRGRQFGADYGFARERTSHSSKS
jgi:AraC-like DNA-binding protein